MSGTVNASGCSLTCFENRTSDVYRVATFPSLKLGIKTVVPQFVSALQLRMPCLTFVLQCVSGFMSARLSTFVVCAVYSTDYFSCTFST